MHGVEFAPFSGTLIKWKPRGFQIIVSLNVLSTGSHDAPVLELLLLTAAK
jgi:hypothetical protein